MTDDRRGDAPTLDHLTQAQATKVNDARSQDVRASVPPSFSGERYEMEGLLGVGGMGEVRSCRDQFIGREVAMKLVRRDHDTTRAEARFLTETRVQARLEHPGIVPVYDMGRDPAGRAYFTMRRVRGVTLDIILQRLASGDPTSRREYTRHRLLTAFATVCLTVDFAHSRGVLHRDLKPTNVMFGDFGEVYVLDWGVARVSAPGNEAAAVAGEDAPLSVKDEILGTPGYMAPEQALAAELDVRADVFALGAILFEILTLQPMLEEARDVQRFLALPATIDRRPSARASELDVPAELDAICLRATARNPADRYATARELHDAVDAFLGGDRDLELRRKLASEHIERAERAGEGALSGALPPEARADALREAGRALALAPEDPRALRLLVRLLGEPPRAVPREVQDQLEAQRYERFRKTAPIVMMAVPPLWLTVYPIFCLIVGVRSWAQALVVPVAWCLAAGVIFFDLRRRMYWTRTGWITPAAVLAAASTTTVLSGPLMIVPILVVALTMGFSLAARTGPRYTVMVLGCLALLVPLLLTWLGIHRMYEFHGDTFVVHSGALNSTSMSNFVGQSIINILAVILASRFAVRVRDVFHVTEARNAFLAWQLSKLLP
jgi:serine/threonine-protein kinase